MPNTKSPAVEKSAEEHAVEPVREAAAAEDERVNQARDDVLAFIHRLDRIEKDETSRRETKQPFSEERPTASGVSRADDTAARATRPSEPAHSPRPAAQVAERAPDPPIVPPAETSAPPRIVRVSVRGGQDWPGSPAHASQPEANTVDPTSVANVPIGVAAASNDDAKMAAMIERLAKHSADAPNDLRAQWRLAFLRLADGDTAPDAARSAGMLEGPAALMGSAVRAIDATRSAMEDPTGAVNDALAAVDALRQELRARAELEVPTVALCSRVQAFGIFEPLPSDSFTPGVQNQAIVYFAVENFSSEGVPDGRMRTLLNSHLEILTVDGKLEWEFEESRVEDFCVERREDFFVAQRILLPARLREGAYVLKVTVEDVLANKRTQALHPFSIGSPKSKFQN